MTLVPRSRMARAVPLSDTWGGGGLGRAGLARQIAQHHNTGLLHDLMKEANQARAANRVSSLFDPRGPDCTAQDYGMA